MQQEQQAQLSPVVGEVRLGGGALQERYSLTFSLSTRKQRWEQNTGPDQS